MKKICMILVCGVFYATLITGNARAQSPTDISISFAAAGIINKTFPAVYEKTIAITAIDSVDKTSLKEKKANLKAAKANLRMTAHFNNNFKNVSDLVWTSEEKLIIASFKMNAKSARVIYDKKGNWLYTIMSYYEDQMPREISLLVKENYIGFTVSLVQEVSQDITTLFKVFLEDCTSLKQILVCNGEITVCGEFKKS